MPGETPDEFDPAHLFTIEELKSLLARHGLETVKTIGKPVLAFTAESLKNPEIFRRTLAMEYSALPSTAGRGGHIAVVGQKR